MSLKCCWLHFSECAKIKTDRKRLLWWHKRHDRNSTVMTPPTSSASLFLHPPTVFSECCKKKKKKMGLKRLLFIFIHFWGNQLREASCHWKKNQTIKKICMTLVHIGLVERGSYLSVAGSLKVGQQQANENRALFLVTHKSAQPEQSHVRENI